MARVFAALGTEAEAKVLGHRAAGQHTAAAPCNGRVIMVNKR